MNRYGARVNRQWARFLPQIYAEIKDPGFFFGVVGEQIARQIGDLAGELAGDDPPGEEYLARAARLSAARCQAEQILMDEYGLLTPGEEDNDDEAAAATDSGHPSREPTDAGQREGAGDAPGQDGTP